MIFLLWYLNDFLKKSWRKDHYEDDLLKIDRLGLPYDLPDDFDSVKDIFQKLKDLNFRLKAKDDFLENVLGDYRAYKWVDIEYEYYMALVKLYKMLDSGTYLRDSIINQLMELNSCFELIKRKLVEYLDTLFVDATFKNNQIDDLLFDGAFNQKGERSKNEMLFICFNYTQTMELYLRETILENNLIYIHGELKDSSNPIIFGYGDEIDSHYEKIENLNNNEFLKNIKSFSYFKTDSYQRAIRFVESGDFTVKILGHSCGLSDRILLNTIFEHDNCKAIKIFHYEKSPTDNDYFEKTQEISRHFKASKKGEMRMKIVPFDKYSKMPQNPKD